MVRHSYPVDFMVMQSTFSAHTMMRVAICILKCKNVSYHWLLVPTIYHHRSVASNKHRH